MSSLSSLRGDIQLVQNTTVLHGQNSTLTAASAATPDVTVQKPSEHRANATFVLLARNSDLEGVVDSIRQMEDRFNHKYKYPWVLLNEEPFTETFKRLACFTTQFWAFDLKISCSRVRILTDAPISFGVIPKEHWYQPDWIDENMARAARRKMELQRIIYAGKPLPLPLIWNDIHQLCWRRQCPVCLMFYRYSSHDANFNTLVIGICVASIRG